MIEYDFPEDVITTLKKSSYDDNNKQYLTESGLKVVKIDDYNKNFYLKKRNRKIILRGADAFFIHRGKYYIIEFKNSWVDSVLENEIKEKMYGSSIVIMDLFNLTIEEFRAKAKFILIYNFDKNIETKEVKAIEKKLNTQKAGFIRIEAGFRKKASRPIKDLDKRAFGLKKFEKYAYDEICAIPDKYFNIYLKEEKII